MLAGFSVSLLEHHRVNKASLIPPKMICSKITRITIKPEGLSSEMLPCSAKLENQQANSPNNEEVFGFISLLLAAI